MLFDERPKLRKGDLFDRETEVFYVIEGAGHPLTVITGIRRIGKTSVLNVALGELKDAVTLIVDCRRLRPNYGRSELYALFSEALSTRFDRLVDVLSGVRGVSIMGNSVELRWRGKDSVSLADLIDRLNRRRVVVALDEAQRLRGPLSGEVRDAIAHAYDYDRNVTFILTGSEVGLLYDFIGVEDEASALYGRFFREVRLERFSPERSREFLRRGFEELGVNVDEDLIDEVAGLFDGIPGWLTFAGL
ncbi:MAG: AAA family ATPase, partial [Acidilobus sp.]